MKNGLFVLLFLPSLAIAQLKKISFDDVYKSGTFSVESVSGFHSMNDGRFYIESAGRGVLKKNFITGETVDTLIDASDVHDEKGKVLPLNDIEWNNNET